MYATVFDKPGKKVKLDDISPKPPKSLNKEKAEPLFLSHSEELFELQELLWGANTHSVLVVLQGRDAAGKDGTIKHVVGALNPRGVHIASFGVPTEKELEHDFLWRIHQHTPRKGEIAIFNRSHYEDVLVARVHDLVPKKTWRQRYDSINAFEEQLAHDTIVLKFFLHISKEEQESRLLEREAEDRKAWKLNVNDWKERDHWRDYSKAYEDVISECSHSWAPWYVVPAEKKWVRNLAVAEALVKALRPFKKRWQQTVREIGRRQRAELDAYRRVMAKKRAKTDSIPSRRALQERDERRTAGKPDNGKARRVTKKSPSRQAGKNQTSGRTARKPRTRQTQPTL